MNTEHVDAFADWLLKGHSSGTVNQFRQYNYSFRTLVVNFAIIGQLEREMVSLIFEIRVEIAVV